MFDKKYKKMLKILDEEIDTAKYMFDLHSKMNYDYVKDSTKKDQLILANMKLMDKYLEQWSALGTLKRRIKREIGV